MYTKLFYRLTTTILFIIMCFSTTSSVVASHEKITKTQYLKTINIAGLQRMLSQKLTKELLFIQVKVNVEENRQNIIQTVTHFNINLNALMYGSKKQNIPSPATEQIFNKLQLIKNRWSRYKNYIEKKSIKYTSTTLDVLKIIDQVSIDILYDCEDVVQLYVQSAIDSGFIPGGKLVNIAGRQRMLSQKAIKEVLYSYMAKKKHPSYSTTVNQFEQSHQLLQLHTEKKASELQPTRYTKINRIMDDIQSQWKEISILIQQIDDNDSKNITLLKKIDHNSRNLLNYLNNIVTVFQSEL